MNRIGLLTTRSNPLIPYFLEKFEDLSDFEPVLIFDKKGFSENDSEIFRSRTQGRFPEQPIDRYLRKYHWCTVPNHNGKICRTQIRELELGLLVNAGTPRILKSDLLDNLSIGVLNVHPGILPKYRGATCCEWAIYYDDPVGVTAHFMDSGIDTGAIILIRELPITRKQNYSDLRASLYHLAHDVRIEAIHKIFAEKLTPERLSPQPSGSSFKLIPDSLLEVVKEKVATGEYQPIRADVI